MREVKVGEVTVDLCKSCDAFWFDMEEIRRFVEFADPDAAFIPSDDDFKEHTTGLEEKCTCCGHDTLERGVAGRSEFRRCTWCGGLFLFRADLERFGLDGEDDRPDDEVWTLFGSLREILISGVKR
jgi:Zn-finger nucleic acid-binding protein